MNYYLKSDKNVAICLITNPAILAKLFKANGKWVQKYLVSGKSVNCYQFEMNDGALNLTGLAIYLNNNYYLQPVDNDLC